jgi:8-oxo-dGTP pyrophosphatase MutT (NUDIX family)
VGRHPECEQEAFVGCRQSHLIGRTAVIEVIGRAVIENNGRFLLAHCRGASNTFLPGGHVEFGESIPEAIAREVAEEIGKDAHVGFYLGAVEAGWEEGGVQHFEVNHVFQVSVPGISFASVVESCEEHLEFVWAQRSELAGLNLLPEPLVDLLSRPVVTEGPAFWGSAMRSVDLCPSSDGV